MSKKKDSLPFEKKSQFNEERDHYVDRNGSYVYTKWVQLPNGKWKRRVTDIIPLTAENMEIIIMLDQDDHDTDLQDRYAEENTDYEIENQQTRNECDGDGEDNDGFDTDPIENIADPKGNVFSQLYPEEESANPQFEEMERFVRSGLSEEQQNMVFAHCGERKYLEDIRREEEAATGKKVTRQAVHGRWDRILTKTCKHFGVEKPKQEHKKKTDQ